MKINRLFKKVIATVCAASMVFTGMFADGSAMKAEAAAEHNLWIVGDSTVCNFTSDGSYYYPRYGYGTQIGNYLDGTYAVQNLAVSGTSSLSFKSHNNYSTLTAGIQAGDTLIVGFGHNDEKQEDEERYTSPLGDYTTSGSFAKSLYDNYVKMAQDAGAEVILCTPIVRRTTGAWSNNQLHVANGGDYAQVIRDLGETVNVPVVDLTALTKELYDSLGVSETLHLHARTSSKEGSVDNTHLNIYGAKKVAWLFANAVDDTSATLASHIDLSAGEPTKDKDLEVNPDYVEPVYDNNLAQSELFEDYVVVAAGDGDDEGTGDGNDGSGDGEDIVFKGTAFGALGGNPSKSNHILETDEDGNMHLQVLKDKGKISSSVDGIVMYYYKVPVGYNFTLSAKATLHSIDSSTDQAAFGLMARDDMYIDTRIDTLASDYVVAGSMGKGCNCFYRKSGSIGGKAKLTTETLTAESTYDLSIKSNSDGYTCTFGNEPAQSAGYDFALTSVDCDYVYVGMFAARNVDVTFSDIQLVVEEPPVVEEVKKYSIKVSSTGNGKLTADKTSAAEGEKVTLTVTPDAGHYLAYWSVKSDVHFKIPNYTFTMPACDVELTANFEPYPTEWNFRSGSDYMESGICIEGDKTDLDALIIDATAEGAKFDISDRTDWAEVGKGTIITIPVVGPSKVTVTSKTAGVFSVDGQAAVNATESFTCTGKDGQVKLEFTASDYLGSIKVEVASDDAGNGDGNDKPGTNDGNDKGTNDGNDGTGDGGDKGNFEGLKVELANPGAEYEYTGSAIKPAVIVTNNGEELVAGVDYTVKYSNNVNATVNKKATIVVTGKGNISGTTDTTFEILKKDIADSDVIEGSVVVAKGSKATPVLVYNNKKLSSKDFKNPDAKKKFNEDGVITITGNGNFTGTREIDVKVVDKKDLKKFTVTVGKEKLVYNGEEQIPTITVADKKEKTPLVENVDYIIVYGGSTVNAGTVKFTVIGLGIYSGTVAKSYKISPLAVKSGMEVSDVSENKYGFNSKGVTIGEDLVVTYKATGDVLTEGKDYKISYSGNKKVGTAKYTIKFQGNYKGSAALKGTFTIVPAGLTDATEGLKVVIPDQIYKGKPNVYKSKPIVDINGVTLKSSNYTVEYYTDADWSAPVSKQNPVEIKGDDTYATVYVKIIGKGNYQPADGTMYATAEYRVYSKDAYKNLSKARVTFVDENGAKLKKLSYTGEELEPAVKVEYKDGKNWVEVPADQYEVSYTNNVNKGKAAVVVTGTGDQYAGSKTAKISIVAMSLKDLLDLWK